MWPQPAMAARRQPAPGRPPGPGQNESPIDLGFRQGVLARTSARTWPACASWGFAGSDAQVIARAAREAPAVLAACSSVRRCGRPTPPPSAPRPTAPTAAYTSPRPTSTINFIAPSGTPPLAACWPPPLPTRAVLPTTRRCRRTWPLATKAQPTTPGCAPTTARPACSCLSTASAPLTPAPTARAIRPGKRWKPARRWPASTA